MQVSLDEFTDWSSECVGVTYVNEGVAAVDIRSRSSAADNPYMYFPASGISDVVISNLPADYTDIVFSCDLACQSGSVANPVKIYAGDSELTPSPASMINSTPFTTLSVTLPPGTTAVRLVANNPSKGIMIDNIRLEGRAGE
jgi:hypothetical protein